MGWEFAEQTSACECATSPFVQSVVNALTDFCNSRNARTVVAEETTEQMALKDSDSSPSVNALRHCNRLAFPRSGQK